MENDLTNPERRYLISEGQFFGNVTALALWHLNHAAAAGWLVFVTCMWLVNMWRARRKNPSATP
jgi:hypothetical protein